MDGRWNSRRNLLAAPAALLYLRCGEAPTAVEQPPDPASFGMAFDTIPSLLNNPEPPFLVGFPLYIGDSATFTVAEPPECASGPNGMLTASGAWTGLVFQAPCLLQVGATVKIGPANHWSEALDLFNTHPTMGWGPRGYSGSYPDFVVYAEDGGIVDWDDIVLNCHVIECPFFTEPTNDPILNDIRVQRELKEYWRRTHYGLPLQFRGEWGAYVVQTRGDPSSPRRVIEYDYVSQELCGVMRDPTQRLDIKAQGDTILAAFHTHPVATPNYYIFSNPNPSACPNRGYKPGDLIAFIDGPSQADRGTMMSTTEKFPSYIIDALHVHKLYASPAGNPTRQDYNRNLACVWQQGGVI